MKLEVFFTIFGIAGIIIGIMIFLKYRWLADMSITTTGELTELRSAKNSSVPQKSFADAFVPTGTGIVPVVRYEKDGVFLETEHYRGMSQPEIHHSIGEQVMINILPGKPERFFFTDQEKLYRMKGMQFISGGAVCLIMGIVMNIMLK
ncbi:MAG: hypothetical protein GXY08_04745 [Ruminococcus sp.]|nr:hypothetical protein [Ruminococcus sp.]